MMNDELELLKVVAKRLQNAGIEYMLTGSMAMAIYSIPRMTRDIDIILQVSLGDVGKIVALFKNDFYIDEDSVREAVMDKGMFKIISNDSVIKIDFIIRKEEYYRIEEFSRRHVVEIEGVPIAVVSPEDLVLSKLIRAKQSESELQLRDVRQMTVGMKEIDSAYLEKWAIILGVDDLLRKVKEHA